MKKALRIVTALAFVVTLAFTLVASGDEAYAKNRAQGGNKYHGNGSDITITISVDPYANDVVDLGITWE